MYSVGNKLPVKNASINMSISADVETIPPSEPNDVIALDM
jgi:hypothetical protein